MHLIHDGLTFCMQVPKIMRIPERERHVHAESSSILASGYHTHAHEGISCNSDVGSIIQLAPSHFFKNKKRFIEKQYSKGELVSDQCSLIRKPFQMVGVKSRSNPVVGSLDPLKHTVPSVYPV
jgi:hypothetical protein